MRVYSVSVSVIGWVSREGSCHGCQGLVGGVPLLVVGRGRQLSSGITYLHLLRHAAAPESSNGALQQWYIDRGVRVARIGPVEVILTHRVPVG